MSFRLLPLIAALFLTGCPDPGSGPSASPKQSPALDSASIHAETLQDDPWVKSHFPEVESPPRAFRLTVPGSGMLHLRFLERGEVIWEQALTLRVEERSQLRLALDTGRELPAAKSPKGEIDPEAPRSPSTWKFDLVAEVAPGQTERHAFELKLPGEKFFSVGIGLGTPAMPTLSVPPGQELWLWTLVFSPAGNSTSGDVAKSILSSGVKADAVNGAPQLEGGKALAEYPAPVMQLVVRFEPKASK